MSAQRLAYVGFVFALLAPAMTAPVRSAPDQASWSRANPFCDVAIEVAKVTPTSYALALFTSAGKRISAGVHLISDSAQYDAHVRGVLFGKNGDLWTGPLLLNFRSPAEVRSFDLTSYSIDGKPSFECKPWLQTLIASPISKWLTELQPTSAFMVDSPQPLPANCANPVRQATVTHAESPEWDGPPTKFTTTVAIFLSDEGVVADYKIVKSSGNPIVDEHAVTAAVKSQYVPAQELCLPVRSEYLFVYEYVP